MKLQTSIPPRRDGTVRLLGQDGKTYVFEANADGDLVCDVTDEATVAHVLDTRGDFFWPFDEADFDAAEKLVDQFTAKVPAADGDSDSDVDDDDDDDDVEEIVDPESNGGLPVESNTPPAEPVAPVKPAAKKRGRKPAAK